MVNLIPGIGMFSNRVDPMDAILSRSRGNYVSVDGDEATLDGVFTRSELMEVLEELDSTG